MIDKLVRREDQSELQMLKMPINKGSNLDIFPSQIKEEENGEDGRSKSNISQVQLIEYEQALMSLGKVG